jgi:hypothetical protein
VGDEVACDDGSHDYEETHCHGADADEEHPLRPLLQLREVCFGVDADWVAMPKRSLDVAEVRGRAERSGRQPGRADRAR